MSPGTESTGFRAGLPEWILPLLTTSTKDVGHLWLAYISMASRKCLSLGIDFDRPWDTLRNPASLFFSIDIVRQVRTVTRSITKTKIYHMTTIRQSSPRKMKLSKVAFLLRKSVPKMCPFYGHFGIESVPDPLLRLGPSMVTIQSFQTFCRDACTICTRIQ